MKDTLLKGMDRRNQQADQQWDRDQTILAPNPHPHVAEECRYKDPMIHTMDLQTSMPLVRQDSRIRNSQLNQCILELIRCRSSRWTQSTDILGLKEIQECTKVCHAPLGQEEIHRQQQHVFHLASQIMDSREKEKHQWVFWIMILSEKTQVPLIHHDLLLQVCLVVSINFYTARNGSTTEMPRVLKAHIEMMRELRGSSRRESSLSVLHN